MFWDTQNMKEGKAQYSFGGGNHMILAVVDVPKDLSQA
jgi:hypothetical protein